MALAVSLIVYVRVFVQILVQNVPWDITLRQLEQSFGKFGKVKVITTSFYPGTTRTNAVVTYFNPEHARHATVALTAGQTVKTEPRPQIKVEMQTGMKRSNPPCYSGTGGRNSQSRFGQHGAGAGVYAGGPLHAAYELPYSGDHGPRGASKRARQSMTPLASPPTRVTPPTSPPASPALGYVGDQAVARQGVSPPSIITDSIMGLCHLADLLLMEES